MADWNKIESRGNVEDRRGLGPTAVGGIGLTGVLLIVAFNLLTGGNLSDIVGDILSTQSSAPSELAPSTTDEFQGSDAYETFASTVLGSTNDWWTKVFSSRGLSYKQPKLVLFRTSTGSGCGAVTSEVGPNYCPADGTIYLDESFFDELKNQLGGDNGDVAQAYVIAHEVGHHVQHQFGTDTNVDDNASSVKLELQADCYAGLWASSIKDQSVLEPNEIQEALSAAAAVGDDRIQKATTGRINPETFTHGTAEQRDAWFTAGYNSGSLERCDTFGNT